jgi:hypothetical protein|tara:strand:+ start:525 stop:713 length:189 start_codon:yes stop_codon:yes gene_type:complete
MKKLKNGTKIIGPFDVGDAPISKKFKKELDYMNSFKGIKITVYNEDTDEIFHVNKKNKKVNI